MATVLLEPETGRATRPVSPPPKVLALAQAPSLPESDTFGIVYKHGEPGSNGVIWERVARTADILATPIDQLVTLPDDSFEVVDKEFRARFPALTPGKTRLYYDGQERYQRDANKYLGTITRIHVVPPEKEVFEPLAFMHRNMARVYQEDPSRCKSAYDAICEAAKDSLRGFVTVFEDKNPHRIYNGQELSYRGDESHKWKFDELLLHERQCYLRYSVAREAWEIVYDPRVVAKRLNTKSRKSRKLIAEREPDPEKRYPYLLTTQFDSASHGVCRLLTDELSDYRLHRTTNGWGKPCRQSSAHALHAALCRVIAIYGPQAPWTSEAFVDFLKAWRKKGEATKEAYGNSWYKLWKYLDWAAKCRRYRKPVAKMYAKPRDFNGLL